MRSTARAFVSLAVPGALVFGFILVAVQARATTLVYAPEFGPRDLALVSLRLTLGPLSELIDFDDVPHDTGRLLADPSATPPVPAISVEKWSQGFTTVELPFVVGGTPGLLVLESSFEAVLGENLDSYPASSSARIEEHFASVTGRARGWMAK